MKKFLILILGLSLTAASCDLVTGTFDAGSGGSRGVLKSEDQGETFNPANKLSPKGDINNANVNTLVFSSNNSNTIYLGAPNGIYKSEDNAKTWRYILSGISVSDMAVDRFASNTIYAAGMAGTNGKIIKSLDNGTSWVDIYTEPSKSNAVQALASSPVNPDLLFAGLSSGEAIKSSDGGRTWQASHDFASKVVKIAFSQTGMVYALTQSKGLHKSEDAGGKWNELTSILTKDFLYPPKNTLPSVTEFVDLALDKQQAGMLYLGTQQGLFKSTDDGANWSLLGLPIKDSGLRVTAVKVNPSNSHNVFAAVGTTLFKSVNGGLTWQTKVLGIGVGARAILIDPQSNNLIYLGMAQIR